MMKLAIVMMAAMMLAGCCSLAKAPEVSGGYHAYGNGTEPAGGQQTPPYVPPANNTANNTQPPMPDEPAGAQEDCATLTPTCAACLAKPGCGWCKSSNSCFAGNSSGPAVSSCQPGDWTAVEAGCSAPAGGSACAKQTNCASCLSGSGCRWCIQGSKCADASVQESCLGGWLTVSYQCNYASR